MKKKNELGIGLCQLCGDQFRKGRLDQKFCSKQHRQSFHRRNELRGAQAVELLIEWRASRVGKKSVLDKIAVIVDGWIKGEW